MPGQQWQSTPQERQAAYQRATLTAKEAAEVLGISYWLVLELVKRKKIPAIHAGSRVLFRLESLNKWLDEQEQGSLRQEPERGKLRVVGQ
ncbi:MAG: hypothetical protein VR69_00155 [Peptococcaceae bacterium BRH_c4b]|nr:MAG: hypothetical protein VR69_00155 [Peptococcaceae bacterium BRH_c4b]